MSTFNPFRVMDRVKGTVTGQTGSIIAVSELSVTVKPDSVPEAITTAPTAWVRLERDGEHGRVHCLGAKFGQWTGCGLDGKSHSIHITTKAIMDGSGTTCPRCIEALKRTGGMSGGPSNTLLPPDIIPEVHPPVEPAPTLDIESRRNRFRGPPKPPESATPSLFNIPVVEGPEGTPTLLLKLPPGVRMSKEEINAALKGDGMVTFPEGTSIETLSKPEGPAWRASEEALARAARATTSDAIVEAFKALPKEERDRLLRGHEKHVGLPEGSLEWRPEVEGVPIPSTVKRDPTPTMLPIFSGESGPPMTIHTVEGAAEGLRELFPDDTIVVHKPGEVLSGPGWSATVPSIEPESTPEPSEPKPPSTTSPKLCGAEGCERHATYLDPGGVAWCGEHEALSWYEVDAEGWKRLDIPHPRELGKIIRECATCGHKMTLPWRSKTTECSRCLE